MSEVLSWGFVLFSMGEPSPHSAEGWSESDETGRSGALGEERPSRPIPLCPIRLTPSLGGIICVMLTAVRDFRNYPRGVIYISRFNRGFPGGSDPVNGKATQGKKYRPCPQGYCIVTGASTEQVYSSLPRCVSACHPERVRVQVILSPAWFWMSWFEE
jgi:hypothetical protein